MQFVQIKGYHQKEGTHWQLALRNDLWRTWQTILVK